MATCLGGWDAITNIKDAHQLKGFVVVLDKRYNSLFAMGANMKFILEYSLDTKVWIKHHIKSSFPAVSLLYQCAVMDSKQQIIFIVHRLGAIAILKLKDDKTESKIEIVDGINGIGSGFGSQGITIDHELHIIGANDNDKHIKYDTVTHKVHDLHHIHHSHKVSNVMHQRIIKIKNKILMFGGQTDSNAGDKFIDKIYEWDMFTNEWTELSVRLPKPLSGFGCTSILNDQYVALFGGYSNTGKQYAIFIYSIRERIIRRSKIVCPWPGDHHAFAMNNRSIDELVTFGFIRNTWSQSGINDQLFPPRYLIKIICGFYWSEEVHLINIHSGAHHSIDVFKLFDF